MITGSDTSIAAKRPITANIGLTNIDINIKTSATTGLCQATNGDIYYAFAAASSQIESGLSLDTVVMDYITSELKGVVSKAQYGETDNRIHTISYNDVKAGDWYANAVNYVTLTGLMNGTGDGFSPNLAINRGMMVTVLYRMAGSPEVTADRKSTRLNSSHT